MRRFFRGYSFLIVFFFLFLSCDKEDKDYLLLSIDKIEASVEGEQQTIIIESNLSWDVSGYDRWISVNMSSGKTGENLVVKIEPNTTSEERSMILTVRTDKLSKTIQITQSIAYLTLNTYEIIFDPNGTPVTLEVQSNHSWTVSKSLQADWCDIDISKGEGNGLVTLSPLPYIERVSRDETTLTFTCFTSTIKLLISQQIDNTAPSAPQLQLPGQNSVSVRTNPLFSWDSSTDAEGDIIYYQIFLSTDKENWKSYLTETTDTAIHENTEFLEDQTVYYWKVRARDDFGGETESEIYSFTTGITELYKDGEYIISQNSSGIYAPVHLIVLGDGFVREDYVMGGAFDKAAEQAIEAFFSIEPYPTYREYFTVYKVAGYSQERGATVLSDFSGSSVSKQTRSTLFQSVLDGGNSTGIECNDTKVYEYVKKIPGMTEKELNNTTVILVINLEVYAGTCMMWPDGKSIAMCPMGPTFEEIVTHEAGGHAFPKLYDEYVYYTTTAISESEKSGLQSRRTYLGDVWKWGANVSLTNSRTSVHWNHYFSRAGYEAVDLFEGASMYGKGIWRPEYNSCMNNNIPYYNAPSREAIVRRIMTISGKGFDYDEFYRKDHTRTNAYGAKMLPREDFRPLAPPIIMTD